MRRHSKAWVGSGIAAAILAGAGYAGCGAYHHLATEADARPVAPAATAPSSAQAIHLAQNFLDSWADGHYLGASTDTDDPSDAQQALQHYDDALHLTGLHFTDISAGRPGSGTVAASTKVAFTVTAYLAGHGTWTYTSAMNVVQASDGTASLRWFPSVLNPKLAIDSDVAIGQIPPSSAYTDAASITIPPESEAQTSLHGQAGMGILAVDANGHGVTAVLATFSTAPSEP